MDRSLRPQPNGLQVGAAPTNPPQNRAPTTAFLLALLTACASPRMPEGEGRGVVSFDANAPANVETFAAPAWQAGDRFVFVRGNAQRMNLRVEAQKSDATHGALALVDEATGERQLLTNDLADLGAEEAGAGKPPQPAIALAPADARYHWPLWLGKRWTCHFLRKAPGQPPLPLLVTYAVEASEEITVPAGTFRALRILRRASVAAEGTYLERAALTWYAPAIGVEVRRLDDGIVTDLVEVHRQQ